MGLTDSAAGAWKRKGYSDYQFRAIWGREQCRTSNVNIPLLPQVCSDGSHANGRISDSSVVINYAFSLYT